MKADKVILAGDKYFIDSYLSAYRDSEEYELHTYYPDEVNIDLIYNEVYTQSLFYDKKVIIMYNIEQVKNTKDLGSIFLHSKESIIILICADIKKTSSINKIFADFKIVTDKDISTGDRIKEIVNLFNSRNLSIDYAVAKDIWDNIGDMHHLELWADKLSLYYINLKHSPNDIKKHIIKDNNESIFLFIEQFMAKNYLNCLKLYSSNSEIKVDSIRILSMLPVYVAGLYFLLENKGLYSSKNPFFKGKDYFMRTVNANKSKWNISEVVNIISSLAKYDISIKTGKILPCDALISIIGLIS